MFSPNQLNLTLHEQLSNAYHAVHRAAFEEASATDRPDPMLAVPVRLIPLVQTARSLRRSLEKESEIRAVLEALLDLAGRALVAVDAQRRILYATEAARRTLRGEPFCRDAAHLRLENWQADQRLESALHAGACGAEDYPPGIVRVVPLRRAQGHAVCLVELAAGPGSEGRGA